MHLDTVHLGIDGDIQRIETEHVAIDPYFALNQAVEKFTPDLAREVHIVAIVDNVSSQFSG